MIALSLGRRISMEQIAKEFSDQGKLEYDPESSLVEYHHIIWFKSETDCKGIFNGGPWFIAGQLLAVEPWVANFVPSANMVQRTMIWIRLSRLSMECWQPEMMLEIITKVGKPLAMDEFTDQC